MSGAELFISRHPHPETKFGIVLEKRIGPCRPDTLCVLGPGGRRQISAVDRRTAGRVGDEQAVAEQLRQDLDIRRFAATGTCSRKLEIRIEELYAVNGREVDVGLFVGRQALVKRDISPLGVQIGRLFGDIDRTLSGRAVLDRTDLMAKAASGAILEIDLQRKFGLGETAGVDRGRLKTVRSGSQIVAMIEFRADHAVRAYKTAVAALNARVRFPDGDTIRYISFFPFGSAARIRAVRRHHTDRDVVAAALDHHSCDGFDKVGCRGGNAAGGGGLGRRMIGNLHLKQIFERLVDRFKIFVDHGLTLFVIGLFDRFFDLGDRVVGRQDA